MKIDVELVDELVWAKPNIARQLLESDFYIFASYFFWVKSGKKKKLKWWKHLRKIAKKLIAIFNGELTFLIINMPPRYGKTELAIKLFSAWGYANNPACANIHLSYDEPLALDNSNDIREVLKCEEFLHLWPECATKAHKDGKGAWATTGGGTFKARQAGGGITGFGAGSADEYQDGEFTFSGYISIDDPLKPDDAHYDVKREAVNRRWDETIKTRRNSRHTPVIVIMQRIHEMDFCGMLFADDEFKWERLVLTGIINENTDHEEALCPDKHSLEELHAMKRKNKWHFAGQIQQDPSPLGGGMIKSEWWQYYLSYEEVFARCNFLFMTADTAYTKDDSNDPSVIQFWGCEGKTRMYLLDQIRGWWEFPDLVINCRKFWKRHTSNPNVRRPKRLYIEAKASGKSLTQTLRKGEGGVKGARDWEPKQFRFPKDRVSRVKETTWPIMNGDIWLPDDAPWVDGFTQECERFTDNDTHLHDDQVDAMTMAYSIWRRYGGGQ
ncbi:phage terminase large subunit [Agarivorans sp. B2Z047]|uniref:phage terminase large subunit n=1 Tax=Agarivorans sp. B2Z047 TaxID=2652721 RepID=UPI00128D46C3|nr:phage terminase large subunit [Agarivorans sp. B2Z047]MPW31945.1 phage terminase large subunit [Agarivorans sp. B2Z047]UQN41890.1 phage terminase large subunit [Agarivorans sp. B2Z047]UQN44877.1 phage terminase large subunit [Agarivorans sp. B2Z047]